MSDFKKRLQDGSFAEGYVASLLSQNGFWAELGPAIPGKYEDFKYSVDVITYLLPPGKGRGPGVPVEVKLTRPRIVADTLAVCAEKSFFAKCEKWGQRGNMTHLDKLYAHFVFVDPFNGELKCVPRWTQVTTGHGMWDRARNQVYNVVRCSSFSLISFKELCDEIKKEEAPRRRANDRSILRKNSGGDEGGDGGAGGEGQGPH